MLKGRTAFITGTIRGIGKALVAEFARNGADVIAHARRETPEFLSMLEEIASKYSVKVSPLFFDMTNSEAMKTAVRGLISSRIPVDILVNNAGVAHGGLFQMTGMSKVREVFDSNLFSMMLPSSIWDPYSVSICRWEAVHMVFPRLQSWPLPERLLQNAVI